LFTLLKPHLFLNNICFGGEKLHQNEKKEKRKKEEYWVVMFSSFSEKTCNFFLMKNYWEIIG